MLDPAQDHVAVGRRDLAAIARSVQHLGCGHRGSAPEKRIEDHITGIGERLHKELDQRAWEWRRVRSLAALHLHLDHVAGARYSLVSSVVVTGAGLSGRISARVRSEKPAA